MRKMYTINFMYLNGDHDYFRTYDIRGVSNFLIESDYIHKAYEEGRLREENIESLVINLFSIEINTGIGTF